MEYDIQDLTISARVNRVSSVRILGLRLIFTCSAMASLMRYGSRISGFP